MHPGSFTAVKLPCENLDLSHAKIMESIFQENFGTLFFEKDQSFVITKSLFDSDKRDKFLPRKACIFPSKVLANNERELRMACNLSQHSPHHFLPEIYLLVSKLRFAHQSTKRIY